MRPGHVAAPASSRLLLAALGALCSAVPGCGPAVPSSGIRPAPVAPAPTSTVTLTIASVRVEEGGHLLVALFATEEDWLENAFARRVVPADRDTVRVVFEVPRGRYAAAVIHDGNDNGELDVRTFPFPRLQEGLAVSHNERGFGRPAWEPAAFELAEAPVALDLELRY